jgi:1-acyl-sn-glycerol-3-phosphate acyltransferase
MTLVRSMAFASWLYVWMAIVAVVYFLPILIDRRAGLTAGRAWARLTLFGLRYIVGARIRLINDAHGTPGPRLVAMKHQSMLDTLIPFLLFDDPAIVLKRELLSAPFFGWYCKRLNMIPVDREAQAAALKSMLREARAAIAAGRDVLIFPEGTRSEPGAHPDYKIGVAALYRDLGVPCLPVALDTGLVWSAKGLLRRPGQATVKTLPIIPPGLPREEFMRRLETDIETATAALIAKDSRKK